MRQGSFPLVVACTAAAVVFGPVGSAAAWVDLDPISHRGYTARKTENTLPAIRAAVRRGASAVEVDVRLSRDGKMALMHDRSVTRTTTSRGYIDRMRYARITKLRTPDGARVPFVQSTVRLLRRLDATAVLEIKSGPGQAWTVRRIRALRRVLADQRMLHQSMVISFDNDILRRAERVAPVLATSWILRGWPSLGTIRRQHVDNVSIPADEVGPKRVRALKRSGVGSLGRNSSRRREWARFERARVRGVVTDRVPAYVRWDRSN